MAEGSPVVFEPRDYTSRRYRRTETVVDVYLPAPSEPFGSLRFEIIDSAGEGLSVNVHFAGPAEIAGSGTGEAPS